MKMKFSFHFIFFIVYLCALSINVGASILGSHFINAPLPVFKVSLDSTMVLVQNVASTMYDIHTHADLYADTDDDDDDNDDGDRNLKVAMAHCSHVLASTYEALNWSFSSIHEDPKRKGDVISHARTRLNANLGSLKTCMEVFDGTKYSILARRFKQVITSTHKVLSMLQVRYRLHGARVEADIDFLQTPNVTVCKDGNGDFARVMDAVEAAPIHSQTYFVIFVRQGVYNEYVKIDSTKCNLALIGEGMNVTIISGNRSFGSGWTTFAVFGEGFIAKDIGFQNTAGPENSQAVALLSASDHLVFHRCKISGYQDSLLVHIGRQFYRECQISGSVDFIFGFGTAVFQNSDILVRKNVRGGNSVVTAHGRYSQNDTSGFSFQSCNISADPDSDGNATTISAYLGRPWGKYSETVCMLSYMSDVILPQGNWREWNATFAINTLYYGEYMNYGPGAGLARRVQWPGYHIITNQANAYEFTVDKFISGTSWLPATGIPYTLGLE